MTDVGIFEEIKLHDEIKKLKQLIKEKPSYIRLQDKEIDTVNYDPTKKYIPRMDRKEWDAIGLVGKLIVKRGQPVGSRWILMKSNVGTDPNDSSVILDKYLVR